jgi:endonuclease-3 related protein
MTTSDQNHLLDYFQALFDFYGPQHWWPGETPFEIIVGAILTQNTSWKNVERGIERLKKNGLMHPRRLSSARPRVLHSLLRPVGYFRVKTDRLLAFLRFFRTNYGLDIREFEGVDTERLREQFLEIKGIGPETADSILLYALNRPIFVVDAYTRRVLTRHRLVGNEASYEEIQELFMRWLSPDVSLYNEYHALLVRVGKDFCKREARCAGCPLAPYLNGRTPG